MGGTNHGKLKERERANLTFEHVFVPMTQ